MNKKSSAMSRDESRVGTPKAESSVIPNVDYILQDNGVIISPLSCRSAARSSSADHMRTMLVGYNPTHYGYNEPIPLNVKFRCWNRLWEVKQSTLGPAAGLSLFAAEDIVVREMRSGLVSNVYLFPYCGPLYQHIEWEMLVLEWPQIKTYSLCSNGQTCGHFTRQQYIDGSPLYTWCIAAYMNSGVFNQSTVNVEWEESYEHHPKIHKDSKLPHVWTVAIRSIRAGEELFANYPVDQH